MSEEECERVTASVATATAARRVDVFVAQWLGCSTKEAARRCSQGEIRLNGRKAAKGDPVPPGAQLEYRAGAAPASAGWLRADAAPAVGLVYEDDEIAVLDKPAGIATHPLSPGEGHTAADAAFRLFPGVADASPDPREGGVCHRLDTGTSGLLAFAKTPSAWGRLRAEFQAGRVGRRYLAIVEGIAGEDFQVDAPIGHHPKDRKRMVVWDPEEAAAAARSRLDEHALEMGVRARAARVRGHLQQASTRVQVLCVGNGFTLVRASAQGGRRHQVRVHLASQGFPLVGDVLYGAAAVTERNGHALHAAELEFPGKPSLHSPPPADWEALMRRCGLPMANESRFRLGGKS